MGAVIYKPKRGRFIKLDGDNASPFIAAAQVKKFIDDVLNGGAVKWSKLPGDGLEYAG